MKLKINQFQFDCEQQILSRDGNAINLSEKPAQLLFLFLQQPNKIHNKETILNKVWQGRAISEQVVFQNISLLRSIFGNDAIKTFVKKGYQWQLVVEEVTEETEGISTEIDSKEDMLTMGESKAKLSNTKTNIGLFIVLAFTLLVTGLIYQFHTEVSKEESGLVLHVISADYSNAKQGVADFYSEHAVTQRAPETFTPQSLFDSPFKVWEQLSVEKVELVLATRFYSVPEAHVLRFAVQGQYRGWQGHIMATEQRACYEQLDQLIELISGSDYFSVKSEHLALTELTQLHEFNPDHSSLTQQLVNMNYEMGYLGRAAALADSMLETALNPLDKGLFYLLKSKIGLRGVNLEQTQSSVTASLALFSQLGLSHLESLSRIEQAWYNVHINDHSAAMKSVNSSVGAARLAQEPLLEVMAHLVQAILASKYKQQTLMNNELDLTQQLFDVHDLGQEHQIPVLYLLATTAETADEKISYFEQILAQPFSPQYSQRFYYAAENLRQHYVLNQQWLLAEKTIKTWQRRSYISLNQAHILFAQGNDLQGVQAAVTAFRDAQIDYVLQDALDAALLLLQNKNDGTHEAYATDYLEYIKQNANQRWIEINEPALMALSVFKEIARK